MYDVLVALLGRDDGWFCLRGIVTLRTGAAPRSAA